MSNAVHFILGPSAALHLKQAFPDAKIVCMVDHVDIGPCRFDGMKGASAWLHERMKWWRRHDIHDQQPYFGSAIDEGQSLEAALVDIDQAILWIAEGAVEQLHGCWLADLLPDSVELLHGQPENRWEDEPTLFVGMIRSEVFVDAPVRPISDGERMTQKDLWRAFVEPSPLRFFDLSTQHKDRPLTSGLHALTSHFPRHETGLTQFERKLLEALRDQPGKPCIRAVGDVYSLPGPVKPDDTRLLDRIDEFEKNGILREVKEGEYRSDYWYELTPLGTSILDGRVNLVTAIGFDRWFGGTHISSANNNMWWRDGDKDLKRVHGP